MFCILIVVSDEPLISTLGQSTLQNSLLNSVPNGNLAELQQPIRQPVQNVQEIDSGEDSDSVVEFLLNNWSAEGSSNEEEASDLLQDANSSSPLADPDTPKDAQTEDLIKE